jgi:hypothetical protein
MFATVLKMLFQCGHKHFVSIAGSGLPTTPRSGKSAPLWRPVPWVRRSLAFGPSKGCFLENRLLEE